LENLQLIPGLPEFQLAALQLIERGHIREDDPVSDYVPEFTDLIILDDITREDPSYTPAKEIVRVKHLLNSTAGLFYSLRTLDCNGQTLPYSSPHSKEDPIGEFFRLVKVSNMCLRRGDIDVAEFSG
jgi:CubicO group peptidase (beta-lactamase class C family)